MKLNEKELNIIIDALEHYKMSILSMHDRIQLAEARQVLSGEFTTICKAICKVRKQESKLVKGT